MENRPKNIKEKLTQLVRDSLHGRCLQDEGDIYDVTTYFTSGGNLVVNMACVETRRSEMYVISVD